jgi:hypothetical protein
VLVWLVLGGVGAALACAILVLLHGRSRHYRRLGERIAGFGGGFAGRIEALGRRPAPDFACRIATVADLLPPAAFAEVRAASERLVTSERSFIPTHKKGGTVAYETLIEQVPLVVEFYQSRPLVDLVSRTVGAPVQPTPLNDQSSLSLLCYDRPGDHIGWHYDHNFYRGRHFTVLLALVNTGSAEGGLSHARLVARLADGDIEVPSPPNTLIMFEGASVLHRVLPVAAGERRVVLSMTYAIDPTSSLLQGIKRRIKDMAFFGMRALWT